MQPPSRTLRNRLGRLRPSRLELISIHVPKTAGVSFRDALLAEYGDDLCLVYDGARPDGRAWRAVHGHFTPHQFWSAGRRARWIIWLRDPVERLVSYYDFWRQAAPHGNPNHDEFLARGMGLLEFAAWPPIRDEFATRYVAGMRPDDFFFVGIVDRFDDDLRRLAEALDWRTSPAVSRANVTAGPRTTVDAEARAAIEDLHAVEVAWYRRFR